MWSYRDLIVFNKISKKRRMSFPNYELDKTLTDYYKPNPKPNHDDTSKWSIYKCSCFDLFISRDGILPQYRDRRF